MTNDEIKSLIRRKRAQMLIHSYMYYVEDNPIWSDDQWQKVADELAKLQDENPKLCKIGYFDKDFFDWTGDTGMHLPNHIIIEQLAQRVRRAYDSQVANTA